MAPVKTLASGESYAGTFDAIIDKYSPGQYRVPARQLQELRPVFRFADSTWQQPEFSPAAQDIRFEIR